MAIAASAEGGSTKSLSAVTAGTAKGTPSAHRSGALVPAGFQARLGLPRSMLIRLLDKRGETQRRRESQRSAEASFSLRFSAFLCVSAFIFIPRLFSFDKQPDKQAAFLGGGDADSAARHCRNRTARSVWSAWSLLLLSILPTPYDSASKLDALHTLRVAVHPHYHSPLANNFDYCSANTQKTRQPAEPFTWPGRWSPRSCCAGSSASGLSYCASSPCRRPRCR